MADPPPYPASNRDAGDASNGGPSSESKLATPRWVKVFGIIALVLVVLVVVMLVTGGGNHGPGRHTGSGDRDGQTAPSNVGEPGDEAGHRPPPGAHKP